LVEWTEWNNSRNLFLLGKFKFWTFFLKWRNMNLLGCSTSVFRFPEVGNAKLYGFIQSSFCWRTDMLSSFLNGMAAPCEFFSLSLQLHYSFVPGKWNYCWWFISLWTFD
jgi:hypothetical protein